MTLLPPNASRLERALKTAVERISDVPVPLRDLWNPNTCPEGLPYLAWALSDRGIEAEPAQAAPTSAIYAHADDSGSVAKLEGVSASLRGSMPVCALSRRCDIAPLSVIGRMISVATNGFIDCMLKAYQNEAVSLVIEQCKRLLHQCDRL